MNSLVLVFPFFFPSMVYELFYIYALELGGEVRPWQSF